MQRSLLFASLGVAATGCMPALSAPTVTAKMVAPTSPAVYDCTEVAVTVTGGGAPYKNPFDPGEVTVDAVVTAPDGKTTAVPGFWCEPYQRVGGFTEKTGAPPQFRVRFAPDKPGLWRVSVTAKDGTGSATSVPVSVSVAAPAAKNAGFLRTVPENRYFSYSDGSPAFLIGENVCWAGTRGLADYDDWFPRLGGAGGNFARLWMTWQPLESKEAGLGHYNQRNAAYYDEVLRLARKSGLRCMLAFGTYGEFTAGGFFNEGKWNENPYNAVNGGPVPADKPDDFFTNGAARVAYKNRLRYLVARYGAFTSLGMWEFWNEKVVPPEWYREMSESVAGTDPYRHPITNSYSTVGDPESLALPRMDLTQTHRYGDNGSMPDIAPVVIADSKLFAGFNKPHLMAEFGISWQSGDDASDPNHFATNLHNGLWSSAMSGNAGSAMIWWWDSYVHPRNLYGQFTPLARFVSGIAWNRKQFAPVDLPPVLLPGNTPETFDDFSFAPTGTWGDKAGSTPVTIGWDGQISDGLILDFLYADGKPELRSTQRLAIDAQKACQLRVRVTNVSDKADLRITVNGALATDVAFDASPTGPGGYVSTKQFPEYGGIYEAVFNKDVTVNIPAGKVAVTLENTHGDWLQFGTYTLLGFRSSRYAKLRTLALRDAPSGETLIWLQDPESNWLNDRDGKVPARWSGIRVSVPVANPVKIRAEWWGTRTGTVVARKDYAPAKTLTLEPPPFTRDIACHLTRL